MRLSRLSAAFVFALTGVPWAQAQEVEYYHLDALGSVRAITDQAGVVVKRHDYLPFGEEWCGGSPCVPVAGVQPRQFTGKERDAETGLDYFGARYYRANTGRFNSVDPLMVTAGALSDPQQWNRYAYGRNNPYRYVDPDGRYVFDNSATDQQKRSFRQALDSARRSLNGLSGSERDSVGRAVEAYGAEGVDNGVTVAFGTLTGGEGGQATNRGLDSNLKTLLTVTLDLAQLRGDDLAIGVAHEGSHVADYQELYAALLADPGARTGVSSVIGGAQDLTKYATETRAYEVSALTARGLGSRNYKIAGEQILRNNAIHSPGIAALLARAPYGVSPSNPGGRISGQ